MVEIGRECAVISWLRERINGMGTLQSPRLSAMREAGGVDCVNAEAQSLAFQCDFDSVDSALRWREEELNAVIDSFMAEFGPNAMVFCSVFEQLTI